MSPMTTTALDKVLAASRYVLLDFDGPICSIFAGGAALLVAEELAAVIRSHGLAFPTRVLGCGDPLDVIRYAGQIGGPLVAEVEHALRAAELEAVETAPPTEGAADFLDACCRSSRPVAVVSNNSTPAVARYLDRTRLAGLVHHIEGRDPHNPALMKPHPAQLHWAVQALGGRADSAVLIGDSTTDLEAARAAGVRSIGYANKPGKAETLRAAGAWAVIGSMTELARIADQRLA